MIRLPKPSMKAPSFNPKPVEGVSSPNLSRLPKGAGALSAAEYKALGEKKKPSKYNNKKVREDGMVFDSIRERNRWRALLAFQKKGFIRDLRRQVRYPLILDGVKICDYVADFAYVTETGQPVTEDSKGFKTEVYKLKAKMFAAYYRRSIVET